MTKVQGLTDIPQEYRWLVIDASGACVSGWEYKPDARDDARENAAVYGPTSIVRRRDWNGGAA